MGDDDELVTVFETNGPLEIGMAKSALDEAEIPYSLTNDAVSSVLPFDGMVIVSFQVRRCDAEDARHVLEDVGLKFPEI